MRRLIFILALLASVAAFFAGLVQESWVWLVTSLVSLLCLGLVWIIRSRFGEKNAAGENRPRHEPNDLAGFP